MAVTSPAMTKWGKAGRQHTDFGTGILGRRDRARRNGGMTIRRTGRGREVESSKDGAPAHVRRKTPSQGRIVDDPGSARRMALAEEIMRDDREVLRALAKGKRDTALAQGAVVATGNVSDFEPTGVEVENPF